MATAKQTKPASPVSKRSEELITLEDKIFRRSERIVRDIDQIASLVCYLRDNLNDEYTAQTVSKLLDQFSYQLSKLSLSIGYDTKQELRSEVTSFKVAARMDTIFDNPDISAINDIVSHDGLDLIKKTAAISKEVLQLMDDVHTFMSRYATGSAQSKKHTEDIREELTSVANSILGSSDDIKLAEGYDDGYN